MGILPVFTGTLVTDALASYTVYGNGQALCGAHVLRELIAVTEDTRRDPAWAKAMIDVLLEAKDAVADAVAAGQDALAPDAAHRLPRPLPAGGVVRHRRQPAPRQGAETQGQSPGRTAEGPHRGVPAVHGRLRGPVRQQCTPNATCG